MKIAIIQYTFGLVGFDENGKIVGRVLFQKKPAVAAKEIKDGEVGKISTSMKTLLGQLQSIGNNIFSFENALLATEVEKSLQVKTEVSNPSDDEALKLRMKDVAIEIGFIENPDELDAWNRNVSIELAKLRIKKVSEKRDLIIAQSIQTLDDLDRTVNLFMGRLREWYGVHFPELDRLVEKHETYARLVMDLSTREKYTFEALEKEGIPKEKAEKIAEIAEKSMGADIADEDLKQIEILSKNVLELYELRKSMENYVEKTMEEVAPNTKAVAGGLLGARLIAIAGSLHNLALRPASTIQVLGAEKALFRSLKTGARPPKHGLIFQHALLHDAKRWQRGKIARVIAGKLAIAVRTDAFGGRYVGDALKADIAKRIEEIREKYKEPPPPKEKKPRFEPREERPRDRGRKKWGKKRDQNWRKKSRAHKS